MKGIALDIEFCHFGVCDLHAFWIGVSIDVAGDGESGIGCRGADQLDDDLVAYERLAAPVLRDVGEEAMLDPVPLCVADGTLLSVIKNWLTVPVIERDQRTARCTTEARDRHRGTPQGSPISPLLANLYFRRFLLAWEVFGHRTRLEAYVVNYADDLVICCRPGNGSAALTTMRQLMTRLGLTVNEAKTRLVRLPEERFDFLGYSIVRFYGKDGAPFMGTAPSRKAVRRLLQRVHDATTPHKHAESPELRVAALNRLLRGWAAYFNQGPVLRTYKVVRWYVQRRLQRWLMRRSGQAGTGYRQHPDEYLHETLGLFPLPLRRADLPSAKT